jgi:hypothetical protein
VTKYEGTSLGRQELYAEMIDPEEQGIIKRSWIQLWPADKPLPALRFVVLSLDTAFTEATRDKKTGDRDPTAGTVWAVFERPEQPGRHCLICLHAWQEYLDMPNLVKKVPAELDVEYGEKQIPTISSIFGAPAILAPGGRRPDLLIIENKGSGISLRQMLAREGIEAYAYNPGRASKLERLHAGHSLPHRQTLGHPQDEARTRPRRRRRGSIITRMAAACFVSAVSFVAARLIDPPRPVAWPRPGAITIDTPVLPIAPLPRDNGGWIDDYQQRVWAANRTRTPVEIRGTCISACTMYLAVRDVCVAPDAVLWFHAAYDPLFRLPDPTANALMIGHYPPAVFRDVIR